MSTVSFPSHCMSMNSPQMQVTNRALVKAPTTSLPYVQSVSIPFGLKSSSGRRPSALMSVYKINLVTPEGKKYVFQAPDDAFILDSAQKAGIKLPRLCRTGDCDKCLGKLVSGSVDQSDGHKLTHKQKESYLLTCVSYPTSDCVIKM